MSTHQWRKAKNMKTVVVEFSPADAVLLQQAMQNRGIKKQSLLIKTLVREAAQRPPMPDQQQPRTFHIPVIYKMYGVVHVEAASLPEAIEKALNTVPHHTAYLQDSNTLDLPVIADRNQSSGNPLTEQELAYLETIDEYGQQAGNSDDDAV